jgi:hypothetical protein
LLLIHGYRNESAQVLMRKEKGFFVSIPLLASERAAFGEAGLATGGLAQNSRAAGADDNGLGV